MHIYLHPHHPHHHHQQQQLRNVAERRIDAPRQPTLTTAQPDLVRELLTLQATTGWA
jgi:hypothetical protein